MDPIVSKLNKAAAEKMLKGGMPQVSLEEPSGFQKTFDKSLTDRMMEKMQQDYGLGAQNDMTVLSAENIQVTSANPEVTGKPGTNEQFFGMFKDMNRDLLSLDSALETLTTPGLKISPRQLLALQAGVANTTIMTESFSRFTDAVARGIQTVVQTQVG